MPTTLTAKGGSWLIEDAAPGAAFTRERLVNVHLDGLAINKLGALRLDQLAIDRRAARRKQLARSQS